MRFVLWFIAIGATAFALPCLVAPHAVVVNSAYTGVALFIGCMFAVMAAACWYGIIKKVWQLQDLYASHWA